MHRTIHQDIPLVQCPFRGQKIGIPTLQDCLRACPELRILALILGEIRDDNMTGRGVRQ
jgi:hypothetical protein